MSRNITVWFNLDEYILYIVTKKSFESININSQSFRKLRYLQFEISCFIMNCSITLSNEIIKVNKLDLISSFGIFFYAAYIVINFFLFIASVFSESLEDHLTTIVVVYGRLFNIDFAHRLHVSIQKHAQILERWRWY